MRHYKHAILCTAAICAGWLIGTCATAQAPRLSPILPGTPSMSDSDAPPSDTVLAVPDSGIPVAPVMPVVPPVTVARPRMPAVSVDRGVPVSGADAAASGDDDMLQGPPERLKFQNAPLDMVLDEYSQKTGRTLLVAPNLPKATVSLSSASELTIKEYLQAIDMTLAMHGVVLLKEGKTFLRAVTINTARQEPLPIMVDSRENLLTEDGRLVSQMIDLKHIDLNMAAKAITPLKHTYGQIDLFEQINSLLVTDDAATLNRMVQVIGYIDQPIEAREEPHILQISYTKASEIKAKLEEIIADQQKEQAKPSTVPRPRTAGPPGVTTAVPQRSAPPGVIRARTANARLIEPEVSTEELVQQAERGIIQGTVKIIADDRTNILIIITRPENMKFFEKIVKVLDIPTDPDVLVKVIRLEYAEAKTVATMLNDLIGAAGEGDEQKRVAPGDKEGGSRTLRDVVASPEAAPASKLTSGKSKVGELSTDNIKILSDERSNALIVMASKRDLATIEEIIKDMDVMLSQVLVEAVILEVNLGETFDSGVDWLQRSMIAYNTNNKGESKPVASFAGGAGGGGLPILDPLGLTGRFLNTSKGGQTAGLNYYTTFFDLNLDAVLQFAATDSSTEILSSPVILTTDNKAATIDVSTEQYFFKGKRYAGGTSASPIYEDDVERKRVGIVLTVTPRINANKFVVMEIQQTIENISGVQEINNADWPIVTSRKLEASVAVRSAETIVLGGLIEHSDSAGKSKVPLLGDIPILGRLFSSKSKDNNKREVIVFITPYVLDSPEEIAAEAVRRKESFQGKDMWQRGWSDSRIADPSPQEQKALTAHRGKRTSLLGRLFGRAPEAAPSRAAVAVVPPAAPMFVPADDPGVAPDVVSTPAEQEDPLAGLDPATRDFVERREKKWEKALENLDRRYEPSIEE